MKKTVLVIFVLALMNTGVSGARAEISQDLDPMVPVDLQATVTEEAPASVAATGPAAHGVSAAAAPDDEKKAEKPKKKTKKNSAKKSSSKKNGKPSSEKSKAGKNNSR